MTLLLGAVTWFQGLRRVDLMRLGIAALIAVGLIMVVTVVNRLIDGAVADWRAAQEKERADLIDRVSTAAAKARARYEDHLGEASERIAELERELGKLQDDPVVFPREIVRGLNQ